MSEVNAKPTAGDMRAVGKKPVILPVHEEEARRLRGIFQAKSTLSQLAFGAEYGVGSQGMVWQYLNAHAPLNVSAAMKFARGLGCDIAEFSPRLADELSEYQAARLGVSSCSEGILRTCEQLPVAQREMVASFARFLLAQA